MRNPKRRIIGIQHRVKRTAEGESRPTRLVIKSGSTSIKHSLKTEEDELKFLKNSLLPGDICLMSLGGSGDRLAFALSRQLDEIDGCLLRLAPRHLKEAREQKKSEKDDDALLITELFKQNPKLFVVTEPRDRQMIFAREAFRALEYSMKARIACDQRIRSSLIGRIYCNEDGGYPEGKIEDIFNDARANDVISQALVQEEKAREKEMVRALEQLPVYRKLFEPIMGVGPKIAARIITAIGDIRLFVVEPDQELLKRFKDESDKIEKDVFEPLSKELAGEFARHHNEWQGISETQVLFLQLGLAARWLRQHDRTEEADKLQRAIECHRGRSKLRRDARNKSRAKLKAFCGVHLIESDDKQIFARKRRGQVCNWNPQVRQALYLLGDQFNRRPDSFWGKKLRENKVKLRETHPKIVMEAGKKRYTNGHIHKMATWKTLNQFVVWLFDNWLKLEQSG